MKLKAELDGVQAVFQNNIDQIKAYAPRLKASGRYKVFENRLAWDCLRAFGRYGGALLLVRIIQDATMFILKPLDEPP